MSAMDPQVWPERAAARARFRPPSTIRRGRALSLTGWARMRSSSRPCWHGWPQPICRRCRRSAPGMTTTSAIALLDAWATVADVLTFYQERIANESYLRTATERVSLVHLAALIGYRPRPGVAAGAFLAFTLEGRCRRADAESPSTPAPRSRVFLAPARRRSFSKRSKKSRRASNGMPCVRVCWSSQPVEANTPELSAAGCEHQPSPRRPVVDRTAPPCRRCRVRVGSRLWRWIAIAQRTQVDSGET